MNVNHPYLQDSGGNASDFRRNLHPYVTQATAIAVQVYLMAVAKQQPRLCREYQAGVMVMHIRHISKTVCLFHQRLQWPSLFVSFSFHCRLHRTSSYRPHTPVAHVLPGAADSTFRSRHPHGTWRQIHLVESDEKEHFVRCHPSPAHRALPWLFQLVVARVADGGVGARVDHNIN